MKRNTSKNQIFNYLIIIFLFVMLSNLVYAYTNPSLCTASNKYYSAISLQCTTCPTNTIQAPDKTFCNCSDSYYQDPSVIGFNFASSCASLGFTYNNATQILSLYSQDGTLSPAAQTCQSSKAYMDSTRTQCISCGYDSKMFFDTSVNACRCSGSFTLIGDTCYENPASFTTRNFTTAQSFNYIAEQIVVVGCGQWNLPKACNMLINLCARDLYSSVSFFCQYLKTLETAANLTTLPIYTFSSQLTDSIQIYASSIIGVNTTTVKNFLDIVTFKYDIYGNILDFGYLGKDFFQCTMSDQDVVKFSSFGLDVYKFCKNKKSLTSGVYYQFYIKTSVGKLAQIPISISGSYYKRYNPTIESTAHSITLQFISQPPLQVPALTIISATSPQIISSFSGTSNSITTLVPFIIYNIGIAIIFVIVLYRYLKYNPDQNNDPYFCCKSIVYFFLSAFKCWGYGLWIFIFGVSIYVFFFYKFQQTVFLILPDVVQDWYTSYHYFRAVFYVQFSFIIFTILDLIVNLSNVDYFLIDWQKQKDTRKFAVGNERKQASVWRRILIVNELYQLSIKNIINLQFTILLGWLFLAGLQWINLQWSIPNAFNLTGESDNTQNPVLSYFIITTVLFAIGLCQYVIRHLIKIWVPLPCQNFVDLCSISNISIIIFSQTLHGYYIHGMNPLGQSQGNLGYIEQMFQKQAKSFGKSRAFHLDDPDSTQTFEVIFPSHLRKSFQMKYKSLYLQKLISKSANMSILSNSIPEGLTKQDYEQLEGFSVNMVQNFKIYLQGVKTSLMNLKDRAWWQKFISCPVAPQQIGKLPIFLKDKWNDFTQAFLSGHEFLFLFNFINWVNIWYLATNNIYFAGLLASIVNRLAFKMLAEFLMKRNISKNTLIDQKFFN